MSGWPLMGMGCGCCGGGTPCDLVVGSLGCCGLGDTGGTVTITDSGGAAAATGTTDGSGRYTASLAPGTYTISYAPSSARYATPSDQSYDHVCPEGVAPQVLFVLEAATGSVCGPCSVPLPESLTLNDGVGDIAVTHDASLDVYTGGTLDQTSFIGYATRNLDPYQLGGSWFFHLAQQDASGGCTGGSAGPFATQPSPISVTLRYAVTFACGSDLPGLTITSPSCQDQNTAVCAIAFDPTQDSSGYPWACDVSSLQGGHTGEELTCTPLAATFRLIHSHTNDAIVSSSTTSASPGCYATGTTVTLSE